MTQYLPTLVRRGICAGILLAAALACQAQSYPTRPVRVIVPVSAGTTGDVLVRAVTVKLAERWGQQVVVDNRPGANTLIGAEAAAKAAPDGYTLLFTTEATLVANPALYTKLPYDPVKDFEPITTLFQGTFVLATSTSVPARSLSEYLQLAKSKPGELTYASTGNGSAAHINFELLNRAANIQVRHIPYKGAGPAITDLLGGQVGALLLPEGVAAQFLKDGKIRVLAVDRDSASPLLPTVPTYRAAGLTGYAALAAWGALLAPAGTPPSIIEKIQADVVSVLNTPDVRAMYIAQGTVPIGNTPSELAKLIQVDSARWSRAVKESGAQLD